ncbi:hypothetical protein VP01_1258g4 [Puccinia sorghi]|uniref:DDE Tnp4 domain-containing protein n=1 Tax=Puccinia sorghi TaxID=27349 RepID=A0A0L6VQR9_9BASI|nr:hypothetical protein VP01_1258g4 [Puccinia sorghi]
MYYPEKFFDQNQFLLAESAYTSDWFTLPAYKGKELIDLRVENAISILKGQFSSLRGLRTQMGNCKEMKDNIKWIIRCVVLHNLLVDLKDQWNEI